MLVCRVLWVVAKVFIVSRVDKMLMLVSRKVVNGHC